MTLREALTRATRQLDASPDLCAGAARDAALLLRHALGISHAAQLADPKRRLTPAQQAAFDALVQRRLANEPIQYITGEQEFYGLTLGVTPAVLIPRPETEILVEAVLMEVKRAGLQSAPRILDVGTGSGAIAIALAHHLPRAHVTAVDLSAAALEVAASNAARHRLADRIRFVASDLLDALPPGELPFDVIVSNPPYVPTADRGSLHPQVRDHEPAAALFAGTDGLDVYRRLIPQARAALRPNGILALEIGQGQREAVAALLADWNELRFLDDLQQIPRIVLARRP
ncbi:MAG: peptide chain release factor N(5)-glutamine methyltransferase [Acidobacteriaceae bacterium]|jgi:release factor glutamine methyltransferase